MSLGEVCSLCIQIPPSMKLLTVSPHPLLQHLPHPQHSSATQLANLPLTITIQPLILAPPPNK